MAVDLEWLKEYITARGVVYFLAEYFNMSQTMVRLKLEVAFVSLVDSCYQIDESICGSTIDIIQTF